MSDAMGMFGCDVIGAPENAIVAMSKVHGGDYVITYSGSVLLIVILGYPHSIELKYKT